jgi:hypothetical protein
MQDKEAREVQERFGETHDRNGERWIRLARAWKFF